jgi:hypothetical protein
MVSAIKRKMKLKPQFQIKRVRWVSYDIKENGWLFVLAGPEAIT